MSQFTTKEQVLQLVAEFPESKNALMVLFPEYFDQINLSAINNWEENDLIAIRNSGDYENFAFWLNDEDYYWVFKRDSENCLCLMPTKK